MESEQGEHVERRGPEEATPWQTALGMQVERTEAEATDDFHDKSLYLLREETHSKVIA